MSVVIRPAAAADLDEAFRWYEAQRPGLGEEFLEAVERLLRLLDEHPLAFSVVHRDTRRAHVRRFPYGIYYRVAEGVVIVVACFHARRDPRRWKLRR